MAAIVRSEHDLPTIRIRQAAAAGSRNEAVFDAVRGGDERWEVTRCGVSELGLPETLTSTRRLDDSFSVPTNVIEALKVGADQLGESPTPPENALWLELPSPRGYLYLVPWERLLAPLGRPLLRLPNYTVRPRASTASLEVAVCASAPMAKSWFDTVAILEQLTSRWLSHAGHHVTVHLFTDMSGYERLRAETAGYSGSKVVVHNPGDAEGYDFPTRTTRVGEATTVTNPWLHWMRDAMRGRALDVVHITSHGYLSGDRGAIALASTPMRNTDRELSRFVGAAEMSTFLSQVGAWAFVLSGPEYNYCAPGLRELADAITLIHPGVALVHDLGLDPSMAQFAATVEMVLGGGASVSVPMPAISCWTHPRFVEFPAAEQEELYLTQEGYSSFIDDATHVALSREDTPAWVASATRYLEAQQAQWFPDIPGETVDSAAVAALQSVAALVEKHVNREYGTGPYARPTDESAAPDAGGAS